MPDLHLTITSPILWIALWYFTIGLALYLPTLVYANKHIRSNPRPPFTGASLISAFALAVVWPWAMYELLTMSKKNRKIMERYQGERNNR